MLFLALDEFICAYEPADPPRSGIELQYINRMRWCEAGIEDDGLVLNLSLGDEC